MVAGVLITGGVMAYGYFATRYTSEFVPALVLGGAIGTACSTSGSCPPAAAWSPSPWLPVAAVSAPPSRSPPRC